MGIYGSFLFMQSTSINNLKAQHTYVIRNNVINFIFLILVIVHFFFQIYFLGGDFIFIYLFTNNIHNFSGVNTKK